MKYGIGFLIKAKHVAKTTSNFIIEILLNPLNYILQECVECLSSLLTNKDDHHVGDGALKCFASLADRFIRKNVDPLPLASNGLTQELLNRLAHAGQVTSTSSAAEVSFPIIEQFLPFQ